MSLIDRFSNICIVTSARLFDVQYGGEGRFATSLGNWLAKKDLNVTLMGSSFTSIKTVQLSKQHIERASQDNRKKEKRDNRKIKVIYPPYTVYLISRLFISSLWILKILLVNRRYPIAVIHAQDTGYSGLAAIVSGKLLSIPVIISSHGIRHKSLESTIKGKLGKLLLGIERNLDFFTIKKADKIFVANPAIKEYFQEIVKSDKKIDVMPIPIKLKDFEFSEINRELIRDELNIDRNTRVIGFVGRFSPEKNLFTLLRCFSNIAQDSTSLKLLLVGAGPLENQLREFVRKNGIEQNIVFTGVRYDIGKVLSAIDIFVLPSYTEGLSTALLEAMACGRAILCSDIPANRQLIDDNKEGLLVNPHDANQLEHSLRVLLDDDLSRVQWGKNAHTKSLQYDENAVFPSVLRHYQMLSSSRT